VILRKDVFFVGPVVAAPHLGDQIPKPLFWGSLIGFFKHNAQNNETCILSKLLINLNQILHNTKDRQVLIVGGTNTPPINPKWQTAAILEKKLNRRISAVV